MLAWKRSWASRVPLGGLAGSGMGMLLGSRTATRDVWSRAVFRMPPAGRRWPVGLRAGSCRGAWWFENWIVDASNAMIFCHRLLYRDFARLFFGVWFRDRSFCDHFLQCDDLSSGVEKLSLGFFGACAALKGVWWMPWQTVPMKDV